MYFSVISTISLVAIMASISNALPVSDTKIAARIAAPGDDALHKPTIPSASIPTVAPTIPTAASTATHTASHTATPSATKSATPGVAGVHVRDCTGINICSPINVIESGNEG
ncbi:hypothetical protein MFRU_077g00010 [Monilinia fructicola]|uniref:Hydrophobin n=1 Tax=Monilinia fructicola TaxID=38448 RepID=A0A5M9J4P8_MONFR|nr:hypothetical protein EYC84_011174 [Monilinia fructicola]KAG4024934.1 hypothetical protein MFRU_077g00010 [Monilinia fructicola]